MSATITKERESSYELIRIIAQFFIVFYHIFSVYIYNITDQPLHRAIWLPLHIGVILFVLISGYFGIKSSVRGFVKLIGMMIVLYIPIDLINLLLTNGLQTWGGKKHFLTYLFTVSASPFWFMRTYVFLYLLAPLINLYLSKANLARRIYIVCALGFISHWVGALGQDPSLYDGKNAVTFLFLYSLGDTLRVYRNQLARIRPLYYGLAFLLYNTALVTLYSFWTGRLAMITYNRMFFAYCSFGLLVSSVLFFLWIGNLKFKSRFINLIGPSSMTIYMIHGSNLIIFSIVPHIVDHILASNPSNLLLFSEVFVVTFIIVTFCISLDILLRPVWRWLNRLGLRLEERITATTAKWAA